MGNLSAPAPEESGEIGKRERGETDQRSFIITPLFRDHWISTSRSSSLDLVGPIAEREVAQFRVDWLVSGCDSADATGFYTSDANLSRLEQATISLAKRTAVVTESRKFRLPTLTRFATVAQVNLLVTDDGLPAKTRAALESAGVRVVLVPHE